MHLDQQQIGAFIHACRREQGLTQAELGERLGVSPQSVSHWERGETLPDIALLPDLAGILRCSADAILMGGQSCIGYRRHVTVAQMRQAMDCLSRLGVLLGHDHFVYRTAIDALNARMNTDVEAALTDPHLTEVFVIEFLLECVDKGDYVDPRDASAHLQESNAREHLLRALREKGIR